MKIRAVKPSDIKKGKRKPKEQVQDYDNLPRYTETEWYNLTVFGTKTAPRPH